MPFRYISPACAEELARVQETFLQVIDLLEEQMDPNVADELLEELVDQRDTFVELYDAVEVLLTTHDALPEGLKLCNPN